MLKKFKITDVRKHLLPLSGPSQLEIRFMSDLNCSEKSIKESKMLKEPKFLILDFRASEPDSIDDALVLDTAETLDEARKAAKAQGGGVIFENKNEMIDFSNLIEIVEA